VKIESEIIMTRSVAILLFDDVEVLDACGPFEVFGVTRLQRGSKDETSPFYVYTVAEHMRPIQARNGLSINPTWTIENCPEPSILLVPGGFGTRIQMENKLLVEWVHAQSRHVELLLSVCTGALILAKAGLLNGLSATTHHAAMDELKAVAPQTRLCPTARYVDNGKIILSAGISAGIDMSLYVVGRLLGNECAAETARHMQYDYWNGPDTQHAEIIR
jgi:transcriptional regulator GlxA family with amidase domain